MPALVSLLLSWSLQPSSQRDCQAASSVFEGSVAQPETDLGPEYNRQPATQGTELPRPGPCGRKWGMGRKPLKNKVSFPPRALLLRDDASLVLFLSESLSLSLF